MSTIRHVTQAVVKLNKLSEKWLKEMKIEEGFIKSGLSCWKLNEDVS